MNAPIDAVIRERALDPRLCCIVQAPAGSGKTELLIQRVLVLLAEVERPEEILAITFTKKAAGEMRARVLHALRDAHAPLAEDAPEHLVRQRERARAALARDRLLGWNLLQQPARLRIQTIDSLCAGLAARLPLTAGFGAQAGIADEPGELYKEAAARVVENIEAAMDDDGESVARLEILLRHLGNDLARVRDLLAAMLGKRDQWLRHALRAEREALEGALRRMLEDELDNLRDLFPPHLHEETGVLAAIMCANLSEQGVPDDDPRMEWQVPGWPLPGIEGLPRWRGLAELLLTASGEWRKALSAKNGVPAPSEKGIDKDAKAERTAFKNRVGELLDALREHPDLAAALHATRDMPSPHYGDGDWAVLEALLHLLVLAVAELRLVFAARGEVDFVETALGAQRALGEPNNPSDLLLAFDYRIRHILVDEFQDTSRTQFELLRRLVGGWQPGETPYTEAEGRSLFLVGDPMQSIYRFREAEVGLFQEMQERGMPIGEDGGDGALALAALMLRTNFRSQAGVVEWVNAVFPKVLAERANIAEGAVAYSDEPAAAFHPAVEGEAVRIHLFEKAVARMEASRPQSREDDPGFVSASSGLHEGEAEAAEVVRLTRAALADMERDGEVKEADRTVAILVRSRGHLARILPALREAGIPFQAVEIEQLAEQPMVQDLLALTRALLHPADRIAWLAVLRAPWCGLRLADLHALVAEAPVSTVWQCMHDETRLAGLEPDARVRLARLRDALEPSLADGGRLPLRRQVEGAWLALGGPACARGARELDEARIFFDLLDTLGDDLTPHTLQSELERLFAPPEGEASVQVMTIHKSKGLQFHTVLLPGLARVPCGGDSQLLLWLERETATGAGVDLLLAPIKGQSQREAPLYSWLRRVLETRGGYEDGRLLYVAATRAIRRLHLLAEVPLDKGGDWSPPRRSLLARLWPGIDGMVESPPRSPDEAKRNPGGASPDSAKASSGLRRLPADWRAPLPPAGLDVVRAVSRIPSARMGSEVAVGVDWDEGDETPRHVGTLVHRLLERIALDGLDVWDQARLGALEPALRRQLSQLGVAPDRLDDALARVLQALDMTLNDARGRWILAAHPESRCEWALGAMLDGVAINAVIDRSFVDEDIRWVIDYKTAEPFQGEPLETFLDRQQAHYRAQLESYAALLRQLDPHHPVRVGLYFPLLAAWRTW